MGETWKGKVKVEDHWNATQPRMIYSISIIPFILNDFSKIYASSYTQWVLVDYACRLAVLGFVAAMVGRRSLKPADLFLSFRDKGALVYWTLLLAAMSFGYHLASEPWLAPLDGVWAVSSVAYDRGSALFALIHWSTGLGNILDSFAYGLLFMAVTLRTGSIVPATVIHYCLDFYLLARA